MNILISTFMILVVVGVSNVLARYIPKVSGNYVNLLAGILTGILPVTNQLIAPFNGEIFMVLILAPLLFFEGQLTPLLRIKKKLGSILGTAVLLATVTMIILTWLLHVTLSIAAPLALAIAAIITPTDATAFDSVIEGRKIRRVIRDTLKMESLFNDATGIVLLQAAMLWLQKGQLVIGQNLLDFFKMMIGGVLVGSITAIILMTIREYFMRSSNNVRSSQTLIYLLSPFAIYFFAERLGMSGVIAVIVSGLIHNGEVNRSRFSDPRQVHFGLQIVTFANRILNSFVFVVLGIVLVRILQDNYSMMTKSFEWLMVGILVYVILLVCRYCYGRLFVGDQQRQTALLFALGGVHGTVTLAMTFSISEMLTPATFNFVVMVETVAIILSMAVPTVIFKILLPQDFDEQIRQQQLAFLREGMVKAGIKKLKSIDLEEAVRDNAMYDIRDQIQANTLRDFFKKWREINTEKRVLTNLQSVARRRALMYAFDAERAYLYDLAKRHVVNSDVVYEIYSEILLSESLVLDPQNQMV